MYFPASILTSRAIDLDYNNAKWHFNEGFILVSMGKIFSVNGQINKNFANHYHPQDPFFLRSIHRQATELQIT